MVLSVTSIRLELLQPHMPGAVNETIVEPARSQTESSRPDLRAILIDREELAPRSRHRNVGSQLPIPLTNRPDLLNTPGQAPQHQREVQRINDRVGEIQTMIRSEALSPRFDNPRFDKHENRFLVFVPRLQHLLAVAAGA
jgi:hypothetical protein